MTVDGRPGPRRDPAGHARWLCARHPIGSPRQCIDRLRASAERTGVGHVILLVEGIGDRDRTLDNITRLGREVLPTSDGRAHTGELVPASPRSRSRRRETRVRRWRASG